MADRASQILRKRWGELFSTARACTAAPPWSSVRRVMNRLGGRGWRTYVVGGTIRDVLLAPQGQLPRDIDLVVQGAQPGELETVFDDLIVRRTRFGGLCLTAASDLPSGRYPAAAASLLDVWRVEDTWGIQNANLTPSVTNFVKTPFLNIDSIAIELGPAPPRVTECHFFEAVENRLLDINYEPNPFPLVCCIRALVIASKLDFALSARLGAFILRQYRNGSIAGLMAAQVSHYGVVRCPQQEVLHWMDRIEAALHTGSARIELPAGDGQFAGVRKARPALFARPSRKMASRRLLDERRQAVQLAPNPPS